MSTAIKDIVTLQTVVSQAGGATTTSITFDVSTALAAGISAQVGTGQSGPLVGCTARVDISIDGGTTWRQYDSALGGTAASTLYSFYFPLPDEIATARCVLTGNSVQPVSVEAYGHRLKSIT